MRSRKHHRPWHLSLLIHVVAVCALIAIGTGKDVPTVAPVRLVADGSEEFRAAESAPPLSPATETADPPAPIASEGSPQIVSPEPSPEQTPAPKTTPAPETPKVENTSEPAAKTSRAEPKRDIRSARPTSQEERRDANRQADRNPRSPESSSPSRPAETRQQSPSPSPTTAAGRGAGSSGSVDVSQEGAEARHAEYLANVQKEIRRHFRPPTNAKADLSIRFTIHRNGAVSGLEIVRRSGNALLDIAGMSAIEEAAGRGRFGPLPSDYPSDRLTIVFDFLAAS